MTARSGIRGARTARAGARLGPACAALLLTASCGVRSTSVIAGGDPAVAQQAVPQTTVYLARGGRLVPVRRVAFPGVPQAALNALWEQGAKIPEDAQGMSNPMADLDEFHAVYRSGDLPPRTLTAWYSSSRPVSDLLRAQIVCSGTAQPGIEEVQLIDPATSAGRWPLRCSSFRRYLAG
ncbi:hypothetical protein GCM10023196_007720 [Actinoallomurus vinaceus]|uniref:Lipoprotein n=1 Tax=Actinoallomurus vinaceus TaxID=1080074 RepID=A0ABP8U3V4_9ACTN